MMDIEVMGDFEPRHAWCKDADQSKLKPPPSLSVQRDADNPLVFEDKENISPKHSRGDSKRKGPGQNQNFDGQYIIFFSLNIFLELSGRVFLVEQR